MESLTMDRQTSGDFASIFKPTPSYLIKKDSILQIVNNFPNVQPSMGKKESILENQSPQMNMLTRNMSLTSQVLLGNSALGGENHGDPKSSS
jgi:hypothetical protein